MRHAARFGYVMLEALGALAIGAFGAAALLAVFAVAARKAAEAREFSAAVRVATEILERPSAPPSGEERVGSLRRRWISEKVEERLDRVRIEVSNDEGEKIFDIATLRLRSDPR